MKSKHVLFLASWYPSRVSPFNGDFIQRHAMAASLKNEITVLHAVRDDNSNVDFEIQEVENSVREITIFYKGSWFSPFNFFKRLIALKKGYRRVKPFDLVHLHVSFPAGLFALYLYYFKNKKFVITEHWTGFGEERFKQISWLNQFFIRQILQKAEILLPVSKDLGKNMLKVVSGKKINVIPNVIDTEKFVLGKSPSSSTKRFLHLSNLDDEHKNITGMLNVAKRLADNGHEFEFQIGGNGDLNSIIRFVEENKLEKYIKPFGTLQYNEVPEKMRSSDCFVLFSNFENQPCVQTESYSVGVPVIGSDVGGIAEFCPDGFGVIVPKADENALYKAMVSVIEGHQFASKTSMHEYAEKNFSKYAIATQFDDIYNLILENGKN